MKKLFYFIIGSLIIALMHSFISKVVLSQSTDLWSIYIFLLPISILFFLFYIWIYNKYPRYLGYAYIIFGLIKMTSSILFLYSIIRNPDYPRKYFLIQYMVAYFGILFLEALFLIKALTKGNFSQ